MKFAVCRSQEAKQRGLQLNQQQQELQRKEKLSLMQYVANLDTQIEIVRRKKAEVERLHKAEVGRLEHLSGLSAEEAKEKAYRIVKRRGEDAGGILY